MAAPPRSRLPDGRRRRSVATAPDDREARGTTVVRAAVVELVGFLTALSLAVAALRHVIETARVQLLWYDGDSVLLPMVARSLRLGEPFEWAMSPTLFFFPEVPVYLLCAAVTTTPQAALALNGVVVLLGVYALVRAIATQVMPEASRLARIAVSVLALGVVTMLVLTESSATAQSMELASLLLLSTYYYGAVLAMLGTAALVLRVVRTASRPVPATAWGALVALGLLALATTTSDPLYVPWSAGPVLVTVVLLAVARRVPWRVVGALAVALVGGSTLGYLLRIPLGPFVSLDPSTYVHPAMAVPTLGWFAALTDARAATSAGDVELLLLFLGSALSVAGTVWAWRVRTARTVLVACVLSTVTVVAVSVGVVLAGSETSRYLEPIVTAPLIALVAVAELVRTRVRRTRLHRAGRGFRLVCGIVGACVLVLGVAVVPTTVSAVRAATYTPATCLDRWVAGRSVDGRPVEGVGQFWTVRPLAAYGTDSVRLLQVTDRFSAYAWMTNLAPYRDAHPTYVLIGTRDVWTTPVQDALGDPAAIMHCSGYDIYDYAGTRGAAILRGSVVDTATAIIRERGFGG
ncbi:hypothetical protein [Curtobacterium sp. Leaf261]|uniref:hypothetical protein n=1 Tax=Curtobacterium sp. Leaf261 TaxID=1736311 RepID=UPI0007020F80|nr:hypothetical protein [Curtobacterium sp. Leaf261]KQO61418.1 hypothetical protein ASF23_13180 [Curtobacterium sp. Leaf261]